MALAIPPQFSNLLSQVSNGAAGGGAYNIAGSATASASAGVIQGGLVNPRVGDNFVQTGGATAYAFASAGAASTQVRRSVNAADVAYEDGKKPWCAWPYSS